MKTPPQNQQDWRKLDMLEGYSEYYSETRVLLWNIQFCNNNHKSWRARLDRQLDARHVETWQSYLQSYLGSQSNLFSKIQPSGISIPSFATMMTVPRSVTLRPKFTSPVTVRWSSSRSWVSGIVESVTGFSTMSEDQLAVDRTFLKWSPSLITGIASNTLFSLMNNWPCWSESISLLIKRRSEQLLTGKNRLRGTLMPCAFLRYLIAVPAAVWMAAWPSSVVLGLTVISSSRLKVSMIRLRAGCDVRIGSKSRRQE